MNQHIHAPGTIHHRGEMPRYCRRFEPRPCPVCAEPYTPRHGNQQTCGSRRCKYIYRSGRIPPSRDGREALQMQLRSRDNGYQHNGGQLHRNQDRAGVSSLTLYRRNTVPYERDHEAQALIAMNPDGMTLEALGIYFGCTRERVRQLEANALRRLKLGKNHALKQLLQPMTGPAIRGLRG